MRTLMILALLTLTGCAGDWWIPPATNKSHAAYQVQNFYATHQGKHHRH